MNGKNWPPSRWPAPVKRYYRHFGGAMLAYSVLVVTTSIASKQFALPVWLDIILGLSPVIPALFALHAVVVFARSWDELMQRNMMEACMWTLGLVGFGSFAYGFLEIRALLPTVPMIFVLPLIIALLWPIYLIVKQRYV